jgi:hypothetical protein
MKKATLLVTLVLARVCAYAVDGQVLINQSTLNAAGGTYTITTPGSYKLSGYLLAKNQDTHVIVIATDHVTIDLNGFAILGIADCSGGPCINSGKGSGIATSGTNPFFNITVRNGTIQGMGSFGIVLNGDSILVEYMHVRSNASGGMVINRFPAIQTNVIIQHNNVQLNGFSGIAVDAGLVSDNAVSDNRANGIDVFDTATITRNFVRRNRGYGIAVAMFAQAQFIGNSITGNNSGTTVGNLLNQGQNLCDNAPCPGAVF